jgi:predicted enzyme related to lactoylglutathione lyase
MNISDVGTIGIPVADQERALAFYTGTLGWEKGLDAPFGGGMRWLEVAPPGASTSIALLPPMGGTPGVDTGIRLSTSDAVADHAALTAAGADVDELLRMGPGVPPMFTFRDPDGNRLYVVER